MSEHNDVCLNRTGPDAQEADNAVLKPEAAEQFSLETFEWEVQAGSAEQACRALVFR
ncbi:hypothetical protein IV596_004554 [Salmonella enterica]|nr:hypothetical protein [Salmonella enterica]